MTRGLSLLWVLLCVTSLSAGGLPDASGIDDSRLKTRYYNLLQQVRCPQCDGQSLSGSNAPMAQDMKRNIVEQLREGASDAEVLGWVVQRYGHSALLLPPLDERTLWLWLLVPAIMLVVLVLALYRLRQRAGS